MAAVALGRRRQDPCARRRATVSSAGVPQGGGRGLRGLRAGLRPVVDRACAPPAAASHGADTAADGQRDRQQPMLPQLHTSAITTTAAQRAGGAHADRVHERPRALPISSMSSPVRVSALRDAASPSRPGCRGERSEAVPCARPRAQRQVGGGQPFEVAQQAARDARGRGRRWIATNRHRTGGCCQARVISQADSAARPSARQAHAAAAARRRRRPAQPQQAQRTDQRVVTHGTPPPKSTIWLSANATRDVAAGDEE